MLHPSYTELIKTVNKDAEPGEEIINSRYSIVMATAKRARQIIDGAMPLVDAKEGEKPLSIAIAELDQSKYTLIASDDTEEEAALETEAVEAEAIADEADEAITDEADDVISEENNVEE
jgi:DNA-directed RNA polymerase subunit omega